MRTDDKDADMAPQPQPLILVPELQDAFADNIRRRAATTAAVSAGPQRRRWLAVSTAIVAAVAATIVLALPFGGGTQGVMSPSRAVAAVARTLQSDSVLHWVQSTKGPGPVTREEQWIDLRTGDRHVSTTVEGNPSAPSESWVSAGQLWVAVPVRSPDGQRTIRRIPTGDEPTGRAIAPITGIDGMRQLLGQAARGEAEVSDAGDLDGVPLVVVTGRVSGVERRTWITREPEPRVVKSTTAVESSRSAAPVTSTTVTTTWDVLPRTDARLARVALPPDADRVP